MCPLVADWDEPARYMMDSPMLDGPQAWQKKGDGGGGKCGLLSLVLEKVSQVSQIVIAIALMILCHDCRSMATLVADMKLDQGKASPITEILATGIQVRSSTTTHHSLLDDHAAVPRTPPATIFSRPTRTLRAERRREHLLRHGHPGNLRPK